jgi:glycosyltransferase involved in cell wall biosynthesis
MDILMVSRGVFPIPPRSSGGGAEKHAYELASALAQLGHRVDLVASSANSPTPALPGMNVHRTKINGTSIPTDAPFYLWLLKHSLAVVGTVAVAARDIKRNSRGYDVVHVHGNASAFFFSKLLHISPLLYTVHDSPPSTVQYDRTDERFVREAVFRSIDLPALKAVDHVIAVNPMIKRALTGLRVQPAKISVIPSGTRVHETLSRTKDKALGLFVGQLVRRKGVHFLIEALSRVPELRLAVVGDGPERNCLRELASKLSCADRVTFYGYLTNSDLEECYSRASFGVFPSLADAMPLALLDCMGHGIPALVSRFPGAEWIIKHGENGLLHEPGDVEELQEQLSLVRSDPKLCAGMGDRARRAVEHDFTWEAVARKMVLTYEKVKHP